MDYFAGLISMDETHVCVVDREGAVVHETGNGETWTTVRVPEMARAARHSEVSPHCRR